MVHRENYKMKWQNQGCSTAYPSVSHAEVSEARTKYVRCVEGQDPIPLRVVADSHGYAAIKLHLAVSHSVTPLDII
jgi:hypothetical protein